MIKGHRFRDRTEAGRLLGQALTTMASSQPVVLGLPRGGVVVAAEVAAAIDAPLDVILVRKLGFPYQPELAMGAIGEEEVRLIDQALIDATYVTEEEMSRVEEQERANLRRAARLFRADRPPLPLTDRHAIIVDDGIATGATVLAACEVARLRGVRELTVAVPAASTEAVARLRRVADQVVSLQTSSFFGAISQFYLRFPPVEDETVIECLQQAAERVAHRSED